MRAGIALGSNIEPRLEHLRAAAGRILELSDDRGSALFSGIYETDPVACAPGSPKFLNAAMEISVNLEPQLLLARLQEIESDLGRPALHGWNTPRTIDADILYVDDWVLDSEDLILPHPRLAERVFVLKPLADIVPTRILPGWSDSIHSLLANAPQDENMVLCDNVLLHP